MRAVGRSAVIAALLVLFLNFWYTDVVFAGFKTFIPLPDGGTLPAYCFLPQHSVKTRLPGIVVGVGVGSQIFVQYQVHCQNLADQGFAVILIDPSNYPESLSSGPVEWDKGLGYAKGAVNQVVVAGRLFFTDEWYLQSIQAAVNYLYNWPLVDPNRIALSGFSQPANAALTYACRDPRIKAVVWNYGGHPWVTPYDPSLLPPVLIFHGLDDEVYDVKYAKKLASQLQKYGKYFEMHLYPNQKHMFTVYFDARTEYPSSRPVIADAFQKQISFLYRMLQIPPSRGVWHKQVSGH
ncbi:MAG: dienelactone hydrolase family protein [Desulfomonilaceae bacterium]